MKFESTALLVQEKKVQNRFSTWLLGQQSWISDQNDFKVVFDLQVTQCFLSNFESMDLSFQEKKFKIDFQDGNCDYVVFHIGTILTFFDLQIVSMILTKFQVSWSVGSGEEAKNRFSRWPPCRPSWISDRNEFS